MSSNEVSIDMKLEAVVIPVSDVDRAKEFYSRLDWRLDADFRFENGFRVVQFAPPGSGASVQFGTNITSAAPGSAQGLYLVVSDIAAARGEFAARGVEISEVFHLEARGAQFRPGQANARVAGAAPDHASYGSFATFNDPDGNSWLLQEVTNRLPGRVAGEVAYTSANDFDPGTHSRSEGAWTARTEDWASRPRMASLVRRVHGERADRRKADSIIGLLRAISMNGFEGEFGAGPSWLASRAS